MLLSRLLSDLGEPIETHSMDIKLPFRLLGEHSCFDIFNIHLNERQRSLLNMT